MTISETLQRARMWDSPKHSESELREFLEREGADYHDAKSVAHDTMLHIKNSEWNDGRYRDED
jgi:hypothetical protein